MQKLSARQRTLAGPLEFSGFGVHSALPVTLTIHPAPPNSGFLIARGLEDGSRVGPVPIHFSRITRTTLCTTLDLGDSASVATIEHVTSALSGLGVDNALLVVTGPECPILDGSAAPFVEGIMRIGLEIQPASRRYIKIMRAVMVRNNEASLGTAFTVSIEARHGVSTGISARDRATTIRAAIADDAGPDKIVSPGHVFPLRARKGGVLVRTGQTEGSVDLARLAGLKPAGVICEIMREDGEMARLPELEHRRIAAAYARAGDPQRVRPRLERPAGDVEPGVEAEQGDIGACRGARDREAHRLLAGLAGEQGVARRGPLIGEAA